MFCFVFLILKRPIVTFDFLSSFAGEGGAGEDLKDKAAVPGSSYQRGYEGKQREKQSVLVALFSSDIVSSICLLVSCRKVTLSFSLLELPRYRSNYSIHFG